MASQPWILQMFASFWYLSTSVTTRFKESTRFTNSMRGQRWKWASGWFRDLTVQQIDIYWLHAVPGEATNSQWNWWRWRGEYCSVRHCTIITIYVWNEEGRELSCGVTISWSCTFVHSCILTGFSILFWVTAILNWESLIVFALCVDSFSCAGITIIFHIPCAFLWTSCDKSYCQHACYFILWYTLITSSTFKLEVVDFPWHLWYVVHCSSCWDHTHNSVGKEEMLDTTKPSFLYTI